ncbi:MAG TPA: electron transfer flavoprotein subunit beta/FixA family protein [Candidatus Cloacimonadota bacterium]|nr:electron transfer flavoprotein subunit beta/FixA family protein [Candidatus Cloacimonadota bacterium]HOQ79817.1 electron transfer flavoprotein subunit beta/FixA family protein [Candidatus Cloacimonadota bacterium]HPK41752.1 electron transfer flavoprotein subunit beta/FixA family protein [Candidatus Cloacimonadota bacterium]
MKIIVCIKQVPDTTEVRIDQKTGTLIREGVPSIINPDDKSGIEAALVLKEKYGAHITLLSMGPDQAELALIEGLAMGADRAILLSDRAFAGSDTWATSLALAYAIKKIDYDVIICGRQAIDGDTAQVGPQIAEHLSLPQVSYVTSIEKEENSLKVKKVFEDFSQNIRIKMPCMITVLKEINQPRYMTVGRIFDAYKENQVERWNIQNIDMDPSLTGLKASPTQVKKIQTKGAKTAGKVFEVDAREGARLIVEKLKEKYVI